MPKERSKTEPAVAKKRSTPGAVAPKRKIKEPRYQSFKLQKRIKPKVIPRPKLPGSFRLFGRSLKIFRRNWVAFLGILVIFGFCNALLVQSFNAAAHANDIKDALGLVFDGKFGNFLASTSFFAYLLSASGNTSSPTAGAYQLVLVIVASLALIWTLRHTYAEKKVKIREGFYRGMYPLIPFILVLFVVALQLIPFAIGAMLYGMVTSNGIATTIIEHIVWAVVFGLLALLSFYMVCSSVFALYVVCLPDMTPMRALRSARELVRFRRWSVIRRIVFLPVALFVLAGVIVLPVIYVAPAVAVWVFFVVSMLGLAVMHAYLYRLYRELLQ